MKYTIVVLLALIPAALQAQAKKNSQYKYTIDLTKVVDDRVYVELMAPAIKEAETTFYLPKIIPGTYAVADYGRFVYDFKALDKNGKALEVLKEGANGWKIKNAQKLVKVTYWVDDIVDTKMEGPHVYPMAATNIEDGKNFVLNTSGFFGYFENKKNAPIAVDVIRPKNLYGSTGLVATQTDIIPPVLKKELNTTPDNRRIDRYQVENYDRLIDSPLMYAEPDTAVIRVANAEVLISSYSPNKKISAKEIANTVREILQAQAKFLNGKLPVDKYAFIFYFTDQPINVYGALEHSYSSFYYMPETTIERMQQQLRDFAAHEFFHIITPLTIHSGEIHQFEFNDPKMSKHLWLYEGVTEYFAGNVQVKYNLITPDQYLTILRRKMVSADGYLDNVPFTDISKFTLDKYPEQYGNVYQKGALIGMCLDIKLRKLSGGKYGLQNLITDLSGKYGKDKAFEDETLFEVIEKMTYPEIGEFLRTCVGGPEKLPFKEVLESVGVNYVAEQPSARFSLGFGSKAIRLVDIEGKKKLSIGDLSGVTEQGKALGFQQGDVMVKINGVALPDLGPELGAFFDKTFTSLKEGDTLSYTVLRKDAAGVYQPAELSAAVVKESHAEKHMMSFDKDASADKLALQKTWLSAN